MCIQINLYNIYTHIFLGLGPGPGPGTRAGTRASGARAGAWASAYFGEGWAVPQDVRRSIGHQYYIIDNNTNDNNAYR